VSDQNEPEIVGNVEVKEFEVYCLLGRLPSGVVELVLDLDISGIKSSRKCSVHDAEQLAGALISDVQSAKVAANLSRRFTPQPQKPNVFEKKDA